LRAILLALFASLLLMSCSVTLKNIEWDDKLTMQIVNQMQEIKSDTLHILFCEYMNGTKDKHRFGRSYSRGSNFYIGIQTKFNVVIEQTGAMYSSASQLDEQKNEAQKNSRRHPKVTYYSYLVKIIASNKVILEETYIENGLIRSFFSTYLCENKEWIKTKSE
jgi:hypothetical protein